MLSLNTNELKEIKGGANITGTFVNSIVRGIEAILDLGRSLGSAIRRIGSNNICSL